MNDYSKLIIFLIVLILVSAVYYLVLRWLENREFKGNSLKEQGRKFLVWVDAYKDIDNQISKREEQGLPINDLLDLRSSVTQAHKEYLEELLLSKIKF